MQHFDYFTVSDYKRAYERKELGLADLVESLADRFEAQVEDPAWIRRLTRQELRAEAARIEALAHTGKKLELYGVPFAVKDNIDVAGYETSAAHPEFSRLAVEDAFVVSALREAGALFVGKTNLDQFATGLSGTRSPYGAVPNSFDPRYISGGSSSGSASVVARGLVPFALGTDTAGSGRVPAALNNLVGLKPSPGLLSNRGVVPACQSLDCVSLLTLTVEDAKLLLGLVAGYDPLDPYAERPGRGPGSAPLAHPRLGTPREIVNFGDLETERCFERALEDFRALGAELVPLDFGPLHELASLLYEGPWIAERDSAFGDFARAHPKHLDPSVGSVVERAKTKTARDYFEAEHRRREILRRFEHQAQKVDFLLVPSVPTVYTQKQMLADPLELNKRLGTYTNFVNLAGFSALALPAGLREGGLPFGITLIAPRWHESWLLALGKLWQEAKPWKRGNSSLPLPQPSPRADTGSPAPVEPGFVRLAVVGAHLSGEPLNPQLVERQACFMGAARTAPLYRLYLLPGSGLPKPGLVRTAQGAPIQVELWDLPEETIGSFLRLIPSPLGLGTLVLEDGKPVQGFVCEAWAVEGAQEITNFGGWKAFLKSRAGA